MGIVIKFPADAAARRLGLSTAVPSVRTVSAQIVILPVIRIERDTDGSNGSGPEEGTAPGRRRRRRARS